LKRLEGQQDLTESRAKWWAHRLYAHCQGQQRCDGEDEGGDRVGEDESFRLFGD